MFLRQKNKIGVDSVRNVGCRIDFILVTIEWVFRGQQKGWRWESQDWDESVHKPLINIEIPVFGRRYH